VVHKNNSKFAWLILITLVFAALSIIAALILSEHYGSPAQVREQILSFGASGPLVLIAFCAIQVIFPFIPGFMAVVASGMAYGTLLGTIFSTVGIVLGSIIAFWLSKRFGRPLVLKYVSHQDIEKLDNAVNRYGATSLLVIQMFPLLPTDAVCFAAGLTTLRFRVFLIITTLTSLLKNYLLAKMGNSLFLGSFDFTTLSLFVFAFIFLLIYTYRKEAGAWIDKQAKYSRNLVKRKKQ
jgi:uncharacterized membrane protein YdjX (TVP38/TMEM64 family)